jgi:hypothetical protein
VKNQSKLFIYFYPSVETSPLTAGVSGLDLARGSINFLENKRPREMRKELKADDRGGENKEKKEENNAEPKKNPPPGA